MMIVNLSDSTAVGLSFAHPEGDDGRRSTICRIFEVTPGASLKDAIFLAKGETVCSKKDNFDKAVGRKLALQRALCQHEAGINEFDEFTEFCWKCGGRADVEPAPLDKSVRRAVWNEYFNKTNFFQVSDE